MYTFKATPAHTCHQSPQNNSLRWQVLFRDGDVFYPQTAVFMCKDYLNDVVAKYHGWQVTAYGLNNNCLKLNEDGVWLLLTGIYNMDTFTKNLEVCVQNENPENPLTMEVINGTLLMFVPRFYFTSTYLISLLSYVIRVCNAQTLFKSYEALFKSTEARSDPACSGNGGKIALGWKFNIPEELSKYWIYYGSKHNSDNLEPMGHGPTIHNCGIMGWADNLSKELLNWTPKVVA